LYPDSSSSPSPNNPNSEVATSSSPDQDTNPGEYDCAQALASSLGESSYNRSSGDLGRGNSTSSSLPDSTSSGKGDYAPKCASDGPAPYDSPPYRRWLACFRFGFVPGFFVGWIVGAVVGWHKIRAGREWLIQILRHYNVCAYQPCGAGITAERRLVEPLRRWWRGFLIVWRAFLPSAGLQLTRREQVARDGH
jgi:hypothetical protein